VAALCKATCQSLLKRAGLYERIKGSWLYDAYWRVADRSLIEQRRQEVDFFRKTLVGFRRNDLIFDIGANHGLKTRIFIELGARVIAVDPDGSNQKTLTERFLAYRLRKKPVVVVGKAVSDQNGHETFWVSEPGFEMNTLNPKWVETLGKDSARFGRTFQFREKRQVETVTLEQMISSYGLPFYIKIDVEGYEPNVLKGLQTAVPYLSFEVNLPDFRSEGEQCIARLREIAPHGVFNCAAGNRLVFSEWVSHDNFAMVFPEITETSVEVFWRTQIPKAMPLGRAARIERSRGKRFSDRARHC
jgi:FkbM family methyltransferase